MLDWPIETVMPTEKSVEWCQPGSNVLLDFHGDPVLARVAVFSDGNHHMALLPALKAFYEENPPVEEIFYATTPPGPIAALLKTGSLRLGNFVLSVRPHVFISPPHVMRQLAEEGFVQSHRRLARNQGSVLLVPAGNPAGIGGVPDLMRSGVRLFISNPETETVSYQGYRQTLEGMAASLGISPDRFSRAVFGETVVWGQQIHHREAPEAVASGAAGAAIVYYHLALRYVRLFPDRFDIVPLGGTRDRPEPHPENRVAEIDIGLVGKGGLWGQRLMEFLLSPATAEIYVRHGLLA